jgi:cell division protease FtsH
LNKRNTLSFWYLALILLIIFGLQYMKGPQRPTRIPYSEFKTMLAEKKVQRVSILREEVRGELRLAADEEIGKGDRQKASKLGKADPNEPGRFIVPFVANLPDDKDLVKALDESGVTYEKEQESEWGPVLFTWILPLLLIVLLGILIMRQMGRAGSMVMSFGKSRAKIVAEKDTKTTFDDVAGCDEAKEELREIIEFLKNPKKFQSLGGKIPKGVLLIGPPGTGKTLIARAVAGEAGVPFFSISGSDFVEMFVGVGAARVRDLFNQAKTKAPCIVFIDEIDAVGRQRGAGIGGGHDEREQTLNQLLVEMDGFDTQKGVIILAATNRPDVLDPALLRPGRFDRQVVIDTADVKGRLEILKVHTRGKPLGEDVDLSVIAKRTPGFTGADLANAVNEAALLAARKDRKKITMADFEEAVDRVLAGPERKSRVISEREKEIIAYHECGHAIVGALTPHCDPVHKVSIIPRGHAALGYTLQLPIEDRYIVTRQELLARITSTLGGRAAEEIVYNHRSTGAQNDLEKATDMARRMVCKYGMSEKLGPIFLGRPEGLVFLGRDLYDEKNFSEQTAIAVDLEVTEIVQSCYDQAKKLLAEHRDKLDHLASELQKREVMDGQEVMEVLRGADARPGSAAIPSADGDGALPAARSRPSDTAVSPFSALPSDRRT